MVITNIANTNSDVTPNYTVRQCFSTFCCHRTLRKREGHSRNPMHWSISLATYARTKL